MGGFDEVTCPSAILPLSLRVRRCRRTVSHQLGRAQGGADRRSCRRGTDGRLRRRDRPGFGLEVLTLAPSDPDGRVLPL
jgi:hypothetical protein